jgi:cyclophilin family peptidyl-prolyl cis-trans isomerase/HEAT repeat protein
MIVPRASRTARPTPSILWRFPAVVVALGCALSCADSGAVGNGSMPVDESLTAIRAAEDARDTAQAAIRPLVEGLSHVEPRVRRTAARALGRFEEPAFVPLLVPVLSDPDPGVRVAAVNALGQAGHVRGWLEAAAALSEGLSEEGDPVVRGVYGQTLGRLPYDDADAHATAEATVVELLAESPPQLSQSMLDARALALARGLESLARRGRALRALEPETRVALGALAGYGGGPDASSVAGAARVRKAALLAFLASGPSPEPAVLEAALEDPDDEVRRIAARGLAQLAEPATMLGRALADPAPRVRWEAVRIVGAQRRIHGCEALVGATRDPDPHVVILALDQLAEPCPEPAEQLETLTRTAGAEPGSGAAWQPWAHAVYALARVAPQQAGDAVSRLAAHPVSFARAWAAQAAAEMPDRAALSSLIGDPDHNVRTAALRGLVALDGREADPHAVRNLASDDAQLVMTAAEALEGTDRAGAALPALFDALQRFTQTGRQTSRDARVAVLERIAELGSAADADAVRSYLTDFDPSVAELAASTLDAWGQDAAASPNVPAPSPVPDPATLSRLARSTVVLDMASGGQIEIRLFPDVAPTNAARFARLASEGYFDGLTFHRIAANFVIQGGSPGANEYWGDGPFSRDELDLLGNWRGTVGLSTRGRDTGDAQLYVNVIDNLRLDHDYTVYGQVVAGMDVVDAALEGAVIVTARVVEDVP